MTPQTTNDPASIMLTQGLFAIVDAKDAEYLHGFRWRAKRDCQTTYAYTGNKPMRSLHRMVIMLMGQTVPEGKVVDHINGNGLDCRRDNLQVVTQLQNCRKRSNATAFPGVNYYRGYWRARIWHRGRHLERWCKTEALAIEQYRNWANELKGVIV